MNRNEGNHITDAELLERYPLRDLVTRGQSYGVWVDRPLARCRARASSSLPVPGSPRSSRLRPLGAARMEKTPLASLEGDWRAALFDNPEALQKEIKKLKKEMESAAKALDFIEAARIRDLIKALEKSN